MLIFNNVAIVFILLKGILGQFILRVLNFDFVKYYDILKRILEGTRTRNLSVVFYTVKVSQIILL